MTHPGRTRFSGATRARAVERYLAGASVRELARDLCCEPWTVRRWIRAAGHEPRREPRGQGGRRVG